MTEFLLTILGQAGDATAAAQPAAGPAGGLSAILANPLVMMVLMFGVIYFMLIRPQSKKRKEHESWLANLARGDEVITQGGLLGKITAVDPRYITLELARDLRVRVLRTHVLGPAEAAPSKAEQAAKASDKAK